MIVARHYSIYHITHVGNLVGIIGEGGLWCDRERIARGLTTTNIGHLHIKQRRLCRPVTTSAGGTLGDYVPFNFCPRSVMLYAVSRGHQDYAGGQESVVHLVSSVAQVIAAGRAWVFTDRHAELAHALHFDDLAQLADLPWEAIGEGYWVDVKEEKQAEFLVRDFFPWTSVVEIGVQTARAADQVQSAIKGATHQPPVNVQPTWYY